MPITKPKSKRFAKVYRAFKAAVTEYIESKGAVRADRYYDYEMPTPAGTLQISLGDGIIFTRFSDLEQAKAFTASSGLRCNPFCGKWNFCFPDDRESLDPETVVSQFGYYFEQLLEWKQNEPA